MQYDPQITIAICTYNRASYLKDTLDDLAEQNLKPEKFRDTCYQQQQHRRDRNSL